MTGARGLLMCCYSYPPTPDSGVYRNVKFVKYLPEYGWSPVVLTTNVYGAEGGHQRVEKIIRTSELVALYHWLLHKDFRRKRRIERSSTALPATRSERRKLKDAVVEFVARWVTVPDVRIGWVPFALLPAWRSLRDGETSVVYTSSPPESAHLLGLALKGLTGRPWVMDLRDPWTFEPTRSILRDSDLRLAVERRLERACFARADAIVINTPEATERYRALYPEHAAKMHTITNGFDGEELRRAESEVASTRAAAEGPVVVSHTGLFFRYSRPGSRTPHALLRALAALRCDGEISSRDLRVVFAGRLHPETVREISRHGLEDLVELPGHISHHEATRLMLESDLLLLHDPEGDGETYVRGKLYDYIGSGRPILGMVPEGANRALLERYGHALLALPGDAQAIERALRGFLRGQGVPGVAPGFHAEAYERRRLTGDLADLLDGLLQKTERAPGWSLHGRTDTSSGDGRPPGAGSEA